MKDNRPILCCFDCYPAQTPSPTKPHNDPNREIHLLIYASFLQFCRRRLVSQPLSTPSTHATPEPLTLPAPQDLIPRPVFTPEALANNPIKKDSPYIIHLQARVNFGPVVAHRYFLCPLDLRSDWTEISLLHFFAEGYPFGLKAMRWGVSCDEHVMFYQLTLRPNLTMRSLPDDTKRQLYLLSHHKGHRKPQTEYCSEKTESEQSTMDEQSGLNQSLVLNRDTAYQKSLKLNWGIFVNDNQFSHQIQECQQVNTSCLDKTRDCTTYNQVIPLNEDFSAGLEEECQQAIQYQTRANQDYSCYDQRAFVDCNQTHLEPDVNQSGTPFQVGIEAPVQRRKSNLARVIEKQLYVR